MISIPMPFWKNAGSVEPPAFVVDEVILSTPTYGTIQESYGWNWADAEWGPDSGDSSYYPGYIYIQVVSTVGYYVGSVALQQTSAAPEYIDWGTPELIGQTNDGTLYRNLYRIPTTSILSAPDPKAWRAYVPETAPDYLSADGYSDAFNVLPDSSWFPP